MTMRPGLQTIGCALVFFAVLIGVTACGDGDDLAAVTAALPLPSPVQVRQEPEVTLDDPAFEALPGAHAEYGRLAGAVYQIEKPDNWNGRLLLYMHGYGELSPRAAASAPAIRAYLIRHGYAWGASSFSSSSLIPGRAADETAALWDHFAQTYGRPQRSYVTGQSMGGGASHIAAERYADRFDGALALCGSAGQTAGSKVSAAFFAAGAYLAGLTQADFDRGNVITLVRRRIRPALADPNLHYRFESMMLDLTGGPRAFDREGFRIEENTNWSRIELLLSARLGPNANDLYHLGPLSDVSSDDFNRAAIRLPVDEPLFETFIAGNEITGDLRMPLIALHTTGDWQVPINQEQVRQRKVDAAGKSDLLVQRVVRDPGHCGFANAEWAANLEALVGWVERGVKPAGENVLVDDLRTLGGRFTLIPRAGSAEADAVPGARARVMLRGNLTLDGAPFSAGFLGARVHAGGFTAACQYNLSQVVSGQYEVTVMADAETRGCGAPGTEIVLWTSVPGGLAYSLDTLPWPGDGASATFDARFSSSDPAGVSRQVTELFGEVTGRQGEQLLGGTQVEGYIGDVLCGITSVRRVGSFGGYILAVAAPTDVPGCSADGTIRFRINGEPAEQTTRNDFNRDGFDQLDLMVRP